MAPAVKQKIRKKTSARSAGKKTTTPFAEPIATTILDSLSELVAYHDKNLRIIWANKAAAQSVGLSQKALVGRRCYEIWQRRKSPCKHCPVLKVFKTGRTAIGEMVTVDKRAWRIVAAPVRDAKGRIVGAVEITENITKYKNAVEALKESQQLFKDIFDSTPVGVGIADTAGRILEVNDTICRMTGFSRGELLRMNAKNTYVNPQDRAILLSLLKRKRFIKGHEVLVKAKHGKAFWASISVRSYINYHGVQAHVTTIADITERKNMEKSIAAEKFKLLEYFENLPLLAYNIALDGTISDCNTIAVKTLGYRSKKELIGKSLITAVYAPQSRLKARQLLKKWKKEKKLINEELQVMAKQGKVIDVLLNADTIFDEKGKALYSISTHLDITERKKTEDMLQANEDMFRELFSNISSGVALYEAKNNGNDFILKNLNRAGERYSKVRREDVLGKSVREVFPGIKEIGLFDVFRQVWKTGKPQRQPVSLYQDERITQWVENYVYKLPSGEIVAVYDDVTDRKAMVETLRKNEELLQKVIAANPCCIFIKDRAGKYILANKAMADMHNSTPEEMIGTTDRDYIDMSITTPTEAEKFLQDDREVIDKKQIKFIPEEKFTRPDGTVKYFATTKIPLTGKDRQDCLLGVAVDITERRNIDRIKDGIIRDVSHSLKTPIAMMAMAYDLWQDGINTQDVKKVRTAQEILFSNMQRLGKDLNNILDFSSVDQGRLLGEKEEVSISKMLNQIIEREQYMIEKKDLSVTVDVALKDDSIFINRRDLEVLLENVIDNAVKFTDKGSIAVTVCARRGRITCTVADAGCGIDPKYRDKVFERFYRRHAAVPGTGLGLAICKEIADRIGADISVVSDGVGRGTTATIRLPKK